LESSNSLVDLNQTWGECEPLQANGLIHCAAIGSPEMVAELVKHIDINSTEKQFQWSPLHFASKNGDCQTTSILMESGAEIDKTDIHNESPLHIACWKGKEDAVRLLLAYDANTEIKNLDGEKAYDIAVKFGHNKCAKLIRKHNKKKLQKETREKQVKQTTTNGPNMTNFQTLKSLPCKN